MTAPMGSRVALATTRFDEMRAFYRDGLGLEVVDAWDRAGARGIVLQAAGLQVELLDALRDRLRFGLHPVGDRVHLVLDVPDAQAAYHALRGAIREAASAPAATSWCASAFTLRDPDGVAVWFVQR